MQNPQETAERIKVLLKVNKSSVKTLLEACELNKNCISKIANGTDIGYQSLLKIADYLNCSIDYLLGRDIKNNAPDNIRSVIIDMINNLSDEQLLRLRGYLEGLVSE